MKLNDKKFGKIFAEPNLPKSAEPQTEISVASYLVAISFHGKGVHSLDMVTDFSDQKFGQKHLGQKCTKTAILIKVHWSKITKISFQSFQKVVSNFIFDFILSEEYTLH